MPWFRNIVAVPQTDFVFARLNTLATESRSSVSYHSENALTSFVDQRSYLDLMLVFAFICFSLEGDHS